MVNEHAALLNCINTGTSNGGSEAGLRICNQKYMRTGPGTNDKDGVKYITLACTQAKGQGAVVALSGKAMMVGVYSNTQQLTDAVKSKQVAQNIGDATKTVVSVAESLTGAGY